MRDIWKVNKSYDKNSKVWYDGKWYIALETTDTVPTNKKYWKVHEVELLSSDKLSKREDQRYSGFTFLGTPVKFSELFKDEDFDIVQTNCIIVVHLKDYTDVVGFCGQFCWKNNEIESIDHDSYNKDMFIYGYERFTTDNGKKAIEVLVGDDW